MSYNFSGYDQAYYQAEEMEGAIYRDFPTGEYLADVLEFSFDPEKQVFRRVFIGQSEPVMGQKQYSNMYFMKRDGEANNVSLGIIKREMKLFDPDFANLPFSQSFPMYLTSGAGCRVTIRVNTTMRNDGTGKTQANTNIIGFHSKSNPAHTQAQVTSPGSQPPVALDSSGRPPTGAFHQGNTYAPPFPQQAPPQGGY